MREAKRMQPLYIRMWYQKSSAIAYDGVLESPFQSRISLERSLFIVVAVAKSPASPDWRHDFLNLSSVVTMLALNIE